MNDRKRGLHTVKKYVTVGLVLLCLCSPVSGYAAEADSLLAPRGAGDAMTTAAALELGLSANEVRRGGAITISGTVPEGSKDVVLKIVSPNQTVFYIDVIPASKGSYGVTVAIPASEDLAPFGTYTVVVGSGAVQDSKNFSVVSNDNNPGNGGNNPGNGGNNPGNGGGHDPDKGGGSGSGGGSGKVTTPTKQTGIPAGAGQAVGAVIQPERSQNGSYIVGSGTLTKAAEQAKDAVTIQLPVAGETVAPLEFPAGSLKDLQNKQLDLIITSGNHTVRFPYGSIGVSDAKEQSILRIVLKTELTEEAKNVIGQALKANEGYASTEVLLSVVIQIVTDSQVVEIHQLDRPATVTIQLRAEQADKLRSALAGMYYVDGTKLEYVGGKLTGDIFTFTATHFSYYAVFEYNKSFVDMVGHWAEQAVMQLAAKHIINGVDEQHYEPNRPITRAEFVTLIMRALEQTGQKSANAANLFSDVAEGQYYTGQIAAAAELGIVTGYDGKFRPADRITREEAVVSLVRAAKYFNLAGKQQGEPSFTDRGQISSWAATAVNEAWAAGLIQGDGKAFNPKNSVTRAEVAVMIQRLLADRS